MVAIDSGGPTSRVSGLIVEAEAYSHIERACHAYNGRRTPRTQTLFAQGGTAYVYFCYGMHTLFNVVTNAEGVAEAVLIRAIVPVEGLALMRARRNAGRPVPRRVPDAALTDGPAKLTQAMGIKLAHDGIDLTGDEIWIEDPGGPPPRVEASPRIGVAYAGEDAKRLWRFRMVSPGAPTEPANTPTGP